MACTVDNTTSDLPEKANQVIFFVNIGGNSGAIGPWLKS